METKKDIRNELMKRQEVSVILDSEKNPGFVEMAEKLSSEFKVPAENFDVYNIQGKFGRDTFLVKAYIYDSKEDKLKMLDLRKTKKQKKAEASAKLEEAKKAKEEKDAANAPKEESA